MPRRVRFSPYFDKRLNRWVVSIPPNLSKTGKRQRIFYKNYSDAIRSARRLKERHQKFGVSLKSLDPIRLGEASEIYKLLDQSGLPYNLFEIIRGWIDQTKARTSSKTIWEAFEGYLKDKPHLSAVHRSQIKTVGEKFKESKTALSDLEARHLESILAPLSVGTKNRYIRILRSVLTYAVRKGVLKSNVASLLDFGSLPKRSIRVFSNEQIKGFLDTALATELELVPYFALGAFAGIRVGSGELLELLWSDIKLEERQIVIRPEISKTHRRRIIPISDNLDRWLRLYLERKGRTPRLAIQLPYGTLRKARARVLEKVYPKKAWIPAGLRKSYTSAMINSGKSIDQVALSLGHTGSPTVLFNHYYLVESTESAVAYWQILPSI